MEAFVFTIAWRSSSFVYHDQEFRTLRACVRNIPVFCQIFQSVAMPLPFEHVWVNSRFRVTIRGHEISPCLSCLAPTRPSLVAVLLLPRLSLPVLYLLFSWSWELLFLPRLFSITFSFCCDLHFLLNPHVWWYSICSYREISCWWLKIAINFKAKLQFVSEDYYIVKNTIV